MHDNPQTRSESDFTTATLAAPNATRRSATSPPRWRPPCEKLSSRVCTAITPSFHAFELLHWKGGELLALTPSDLS